MTISIILKNIKKSVSILKIKALLWRKQYDKATKEVNAGMSKWRDDLNFLLVAQDVFRQSKNWALYFEVFRWAEKLYPKKVRLKWNFGTALLGKFHYKEATKEFEYCVTNWELFETKSLVLVNTKARLAISYAFIWEWDKVLQLIKEIKSENTQDLDLIFCQLLYNVYSHPEKVLSFLDENIKLQPRLYALYYWKGLYLQYYHHDIKGALQYYETALRKTERLILKNRLDPYFWSHHLYANPYDILNKALDICFNLGNSRKANQLVFLCKLKLLHGYIDFNFMSVDIELKQKKFKNAEKKIYSRLKKRLSKGQLIEHWILLAKIQLTQGKNEEGLKNISHAISLDTYSYSAKMLLGDIQLKQSDWRSALQTYSRLVEINPFLFSNWKKLAICQVSLGDLRSSLISYQRSVALNPYDANTWIEIGKIHLKNNQADKALKALNKGLKYNWVNQENKEEALKMISEIQQTKL